MTREEVKELLDRELEKPYPNPCLVTACEAFLSVTRKEFSTFTDKSQLKED